MTILVLDTNALGKGHYSAAALRKLVELAGPNAQAVVPEVVIWEWAEHLRSAYLAVGVALRAIQIETDILDRPKLDPVKTLEELTADIERSVKKSASIWRPPIELWRGALREQVLQVRSGEKKSGVKTGAADAVVLACVEAQLEASEELIVLLSGDERLRKNVKTLGHVVLARGHGDLLQAINSFVPATEKLISQLDEQIVSFLNGRVSSLVSPEYGVGVHFGPGYEPWHPSAILSSIDVSHVIDVDVLGLEVEEGDGKRMGVGQLRLLGKMKGTILDRDMSGALGASDFEVDFSHEYLDVPVSITWDQDWMIEDVYPTGTAVLVLYNPEAEAPDGYDTGEFRAKAGV